MFSCSPSDETDLGEEGTSPKELFSSFVVNVSKEFLVLSFLRALSLRLSAWAIVIN